MSFQVLITTEYACSYGVSISTQVVEFDNRQQAIDAKEIINKQRFAGSSKSQNALCLFNTEPGHER